MEKTSFEKVKITTGIDPAFLASTLTTDIELIDSLFDLIDNSIDAARNVILSQKHNTDIFGLPQDYNGFNISLRISDNKIIISDNCYGIDDSTLEKTAFFVGKRSSHKFGIGFYGLGLKRALLKAGSQFSMITNNENHLYKINFNSNDLAGNQKQITAKRYPSKNKKRTIFIASDLKPEIKHQLQSSDWQDNAFEQLSIRYSEFIKKGLKLTLTFSCSTHRATKPIPSTNPDLRQVSPIIPFGLQKNFGKLKVFFNIGVHEKYKYAGEIDHNPKENSSTTNSFGIYFICNDRVIVAHSRESKHGFLTAWHSEYNGFIAYVRIVTDDPENLPWNTAKTELLVNNPTFLAIKKELEPLAKKYRSQSKQAINFWQKLKKDHPETERKKLFAKKYNLGEISLKQGGEKDSKSTVSKKSKNRKSRKDSTLHSEEWKTLLPNSSNYALGRFHIVNNLIIEASRLEIERHPHSAALLYRSIFEGTLKSYINFIKKAEEVKNHFYSSKEGQKKNHSANQQKQQGIDVWMIRSWMLDNLDILPSGEKSALTLALRKLKNHFQKLNGIVHGQELINAHEVKTIRNETILLLEFLLNAISESP